MTYPLHMWLAGDGEGVVLVCNGPCEDTGAGDLVMAEYGDTDLRRSVPHFEPSDLTGFVAFVERHGRSCKTEWAADEPNWGPIEALIPQDQWGQWMWMARVEHDGHRIEQYKHSETRGYLNLSAGGQAWRVTHIWLDCDPWCEEPHEHIKNSVLVDVAAIDLDEAFRWANVWPWSLNDPDRPRPEWMPLGSGDPR